MNIILIGYRATGKTTVARLIADWIGWEAVDADVEIEHRAGKTIAAIFADEGERGFRDREAEVIAALCARDRLVIAAGGGAPLREENRAAMREGGVVVWLKARPETIHGRMRGDATTVTRRPSLTGHDPLAEIVALLQEREPIYRAAAREIVDTEGRSPKGVAAEILERVKPLPDGGDLL